MGIEGLSTAAIKTGADVAEEAIRNAILDGRLAPGSELREAALGAQLGLSRTPIREALQSLQAAGLVETTRGRVARVRTKSPAEVDAAYSLRSVIEGYAARLAAGSISAHVISELRASCQRFESHIDSDDAQPLVRENQFFHGLIHDNCGNPLVAPVARQLVEMPLLYSSYATYSRERRLLSHHQHLAIVDAIERGDADEAQQVMEAHIKGAGEAALAVLEAPQADGIASA